MNQTSFTTWNLLANRLFRPESISELSANLGRVSTESKRVSFLDKLAKDNILNALKDIRFGFLVIEDHGETYEFGTQGEEPSARVIVNDKRAYKQFAFGGNVGGAEAYILSYWHTPDLLQVTRLLAKNIEILSKIDRSKSWIQSIATKLFHTLNLNSVHGSKRNIGAHYDLGNDFFATFLDSSMMYSAAIFEKPEQTLLEASLNKLERVCQKLQLKETDHLIEIGTGWGGMAIYAASHYGCRVTTTTLSEQQFHYTQEKVKALGLENKVEVLLKDYRLLEGCYDKLVSIEMIEAVGAEHYQSYFEKCSALLKDDGLMLIQAITIPDQRYQASLKSVDFIQTYIFPGGRLPSNQVLADNLAKFTDLQLVDYHDIGQDYAKTLAYWRENFYTNHQQIKAQHFDEFFCRMWEYYLCYCEGGFKERAISTVQYLMAKPQATFYLADR